MKKSILISLAVVLILAIGFVLVISRHNAELSPPEQVVANPKPETLSPGTIEAEVQPQPALVPERSDLSQLTKDQLQSLITAAGQNAIKAAIKRAGPAVVQIEVTKEGASPFWFFEDPFFKRFFGEPPFQERRMERALGSGFVIEFAGKKYILTNNHVVEGATSIRVTMPQGKTFHAELIGGDEMLDVAVLNIAVQDLPTVELGDSSKVEIGDWAIAIGNPLGLQHTVTAGIISALDRDVPKPDGQGYFRSMIQTDAAINPGNSGGPLVNALGQVIGINTAIVLGSEGINFAIPINSVKQILPQLIEKGKVTRAWLGVQIQDLTEDLALQFGVEPSEGVLIADVLRGAPAEGKLQRGDIVLSVNGQKVRNVDELQQAIMFKRVGEEVTLEVIRSRQKMTVKVTLGERPGEAALMRKPQEEPLSKFGITVQENSPEMAEKLGLGTTQGVIIVDVAPGSKAYWAGLQQGDVILEVNRQPINSVEDWNRIVGELKEEASPVLTIMREGRTFFVPLR